MTSRWCILRRPPEQESDKQEAQCAAASKVENAPCLGIPAGEFARRILAKIGSASLDVSMVSIAAKSRSGAAAMHKSASPQSLAGRLIIADCRAGDVVGQLSRVGQRPLRASLPS